jgi:hypothetical protein
MCKLRALVIVSSLLFTLPAASANAQTPLQLNTPIERALETNTIHEFTVTLAENTYIQLVVEQRGIDILVKVFAPDKKNAREYDTPNGNDGPEYVSFVAVTAGAYRLSLASLDPWNESSGNYVIKILEMRPATDQEIKDSKNLETVKARGLVLLLDMEDSIQQIKSAQTRIKYQLQASQLLWESDEKRAAKYLADAITGLKEFLATIDINDEKYFEQYSTIAQLRYEIANVLSARDPNAALSFVESTVPQVEPYGNRRNQLEQESQLQISIANQIIRNDPVRALEIARRSLKVGYTGSLNLTLMQLRRLKPELATEFENEIAAKLMNEKLLQNPEAANLAMNLIRSERGSVRRVQTLPANGMAPAMAPIERYKELLQKMLAEALSVSTSQGYTPERDAALNLLGGLQSLGPALDSVAVGSAAAVEKRLAEYNRTVNRQSTGQQKLQETIANSPVDTALEAIEQASPELREQLYLQLAGREANNGDLTRARQIVNDRVSNLQQRRQSLMNIEEQEIYRALNKGKVDEALRSIANLRTPRERSRQLAQLASQIGPGLKRAAALNLLEQARALLGPSTQAQDQDHMRALFEIARAFSRYDAKRAMEIVEPLIDQFNEISTAARTLEGFGTEYFEGEELNLLNGSGLANAAAQMSTALASLALSNFDRAKMASDRIGLPEVRLKVYLEIAQQTIQGAK